MIEKIQKFLAVVFLTLLVWTWAFLSLEKDLILTGSLNIAPSTPPNLQVSFLNEDGTVIDNLKLNLTFKGAPTKIADLDKRYNAGDQDPSKERLEFFYNPADAAYGHTQPNEYTLEITELIRRNLGTRDLALTVSSCQPDKVRVRVDELVLKNLTIEVRDQNNNPIAHELIEPARIEMYVPQSHNGPAIVSLTSQQIASARTGSIREKPFVVSGDRPPRYFDQYVQVRLPSTAPLEDRVFQPKRIGFILPPDLQGRYKVELVNDTDLKTMNFKAAGEAMQAYEQQSYHLLVQVQEGDENLNPIPPRPVIYNFPPEMVRKGLIQAPTPPAQARIRLVPLAAGSPLP